MKATQKGKQPQTVKKPIQEPVVEKKSTFSPGMNDKDFRTLVLKELRSVSRDTSSAWRCLENGRISPLPRINMLFGLNEQVVKCGESRIAKNLFSPMALEKAMKSGPALSALMGGEIKVRTMFDKETVDDFC